MSAHAYWRINVTANNGSSSNLGFAEMQYRITAGGANQATGGTATASSELPGYDASKAFDGNASTFWISTGGPTQWLAYHFAASKDIVEYTIAARNDIYLSDSPKDWQIQYSDDGSTWTTAATVTGQTGWSSGEVRTFSVPVQTRKRRAVVIVAS